MTVAAGISPKLAAERLGHTSTAFFLDIYGHSDDSMHDSAAEKLAAVMLGDG